MKKAFFSFGILFLALAVFAGCTTTLKDYNHTSVGKSEGTVVGKVTVLYNGTEMNEKCSVCFSSSSGPCYKLGKDGFVVMKMKAGPSSLRRVVCEDVSEHHYNMTGGEFIVAAGQRNYIGDVTLEWTNLGGFKVAGLFGLAGAISDDSRNDGSIKTKVLNDPNAAAAAYKMATGHEDAGPLKESLPSEIR